jgi:hypothetical protein
LWLFCRISRADPEPGNRRHQIIGLLFQTFRCGGSLFHERGILLGNLVDLGNRFGHLFYAGTLFLAGIGNIHYQVGYLLKTGNHFIHGAAGKKQNIVNARSLLCYWAVRELGVSMSSLSRRFSISLPAVSKAVYRGKRIAEDNAFKLIIS